MEEAYKGRPEPSAGDQQAIPHDALPQHLRLALRPCARARLPHTEPWQLETWRAARLWTRGTPWGGSILVSIPVYWCGHRRLAWVADWRYSSACAGRHCTRVPTSSRRRLSRSLVHPLISSLTGSRLTEMCLISPGLNTAANHGFLSRDGVTNFNELVAAQQNLYNVRSLSIR
jgi:hypothetical protein